MTRSIFFRAIVASLLISVFVSGAYAQTDNTKTGVVDVQEVWEKAPRAQQYDDDLKQFRLALKKKIDIRAQNLMLNDEEIKELIELTIKEQTTEAEKARITELQNLERERDKALKDLQSKAEPAEEEKARLKELQDMQTKSTETMQSIYSDYENQIDAKVKEYGAQFADEMKEAIKAVAEEKGLTMVLDSMAALYGGTDITDSVIGKLDRKVK